MDIILQSVTPSEWNRAEGEFGDYGEENEEQLVEKVFYPPLFVVSSSAKQQLSSNKLQCNLLIVGVEGAGASFVRSVFPKRTLVASLLLPEIPVGEASIDGSQSEYTCNFYTLESNPAVIVAECRYHVEALRCSDWTDTVFSNIDAKRIVVLDSIQQSDYKVARVPEPPLVRVLQSSLDKQEHNIKWNLFLETPNIIAGLSASILTKSQIYKKKTIALISLVENRLLESEALRAYEGLMKDILETEKISINFSAVNYSPALQQYKKRKVNPLYL